MHHCTQSLHITWNSFMLHQQHVNVMGKIMDLLNVGCTAKIYWYLWDIILSTELSIYTFDFSSNVVGIFYMLLHKSLIFSFNQRWSQNEETKKKIIISENKAHQRYFKMISSKISSLRLRCSKLGVTKSAFDKKMDAFRQFFPVTFDME